MENLFIFWIVICILVCFIEAITQQIVAIWFAAGSFVCIFLSYFGFDFSIQLIVFILVSILAMFLVRPYTLKKLKPTIVSTNTDGLIGKTAIVAMDFNSLTKEGRVLAQGMDWAAKTMDTEILKKGQEVVIQQIEGVKLLVSREDK